MKYHFKVRKEREGFSARGIELKECRTEGNTMEELIQNIQEALNLYIQEPENDNDLPSLPDKSKKTSRRVVEVAVDPEIARSFMTRYYRIKYGMKKKEALDALSSKEKKSSTDKSPSFEFSLKDLSNTKKILLNLKRCLKKNDADGAMEMIDFYLKPSNKKKTKNLKKGVLEEKQMQFFN